ncbi:MAG: hypothetical protein IJO59_02610 [Clostridia bacterium]|nr:hypothetical protein [Clostridia bacterium]
MSAPTPEQLQALLQFAAKQLGTTPDQLQKTVQNTDVGNLVNDPKKVEQLLSSPKAQALLREWLGGTR